MRTLFSAFALLLVVSSTSAQQRRTIFPEDATLQRVATFSHDFQQDLTPYSAARLTAGGLAGGAIGLAVGALIGAAVTDNENDNDPDSEWVDRLWGAIAGGAAGEAIGLATGVHLANKRRGNLLLGLAASAVIGGIGVAILLENGDPPAAPLALALTPIAQLAATIAIERRTTGR